jgi:hypothetical protein
MYIGLLSAAIPVAGHTFKPYTNMSISKNSFGVGHFNISIDYVLVDYESGTFRAHNSGFPSMYQIVNSFLNSNYYGVYAVDGSSFLLKRNYTSPAIVLTAPSLYITPDQFSYTGMMLKNGDLEIPKNVLNTSIAAEIYFPIPGKYNTSINLEVTNISRNSQISEILLPRVGVRILHEINVSIPKGGIFKKDLEFSFNISSPGYYWIKLFINNHRDDVFVSAMTVSYL